MLPPAEMYCSAMSAASKQKSCLNSTVNLVGTASFDQVYPAEQSNRFRLVHHYFKQGGHKVEWQMLVYTQFTEV